MPATSAPNASPQLLLAVVCGGTAGERLAACQVLEGHGFVATEVRSVHDLADLGLGEVALCVLIAGDDPVGAIQRASQLVPEARLLMAGRDDVRLAAAAVRAGAWDYLSRSDLVDRLPRAIDGLHGVTPRAFMRRLRKSDLLVGVSPAIQEVLRLLDRACRSDVPVLVSGESGTGKELAARIVHYAGKRAQLPFVALNCGAVPETLIEAELFGHAKGAFTGAVQSKRGLFVEADGGTLFLDEIGDAPAALQTKLLRVVETGEVTPVGSTRPVSVDVRLISASNRNLQESVRLGEFRADLYYRLCTFPVEMPPLRDRPEDIPLLALHFLRNGQVGRQGGPKRISSKALRKLMGHPWPGNVRELLNVLSRAAVMAAGDVIEEAGISLPDDDDPSESLPTFREAKKAFEAEYVRRVLALTGGVVSEAARMAGKERKDFYVLMRRHGIDPIQFRSGAA
jgi:two-component system, NtrC family, response regulator GlrR